MQFALQIKEIKKNRPDRVYFRLSSECNLSCSYCFQNNEKNVTAYKVVDLYLYERMLDMLIGKYAQGDCQLVFFGGEPLLVENTSNIRYLFQYATRHSLPVMIYTNGCFDAHYRSILLEYQDVIQTLVITLDGPASIHNRRRRHIDPNIDSYRTIIDNILECTRVQLPVQIQINVDRENILSLDALFQYIAHTLPGNSISCFLNPVRHIDHGIDELSLLQTYVDLRRKYSMVNLHVNSICLKRLAGYLLHGHIQPKRCSIGDDIVLDFQKESIYSCPQESKFCVGRFDTGSITIDEGKVQAFSKYALKEGPICRQCILRNLCSFGCVVDSDIDGNRCKRNVTSVIDYILSNFELFFPMEMKISEQKGVSIAK
jgi:uncharacterized protein